jgi:hypothetical protein
MHTEGPSLDTLTRRLAECPDDLRGEPRIRGGGAVAVDAVVFDLVRDLGGSIEDLNLLQPFTATQSPDRNHLRLVMLCCWLLRDQWFVRAATYAAPALEFLQEGLNELSVLVAADQFVLDPDRREELVRLCLTALGLRPSGETAFQADDRLKTLNSVERIRVIRETQEAQTRARKLREQMRRKQAAEAAARASRE